MDGASSDAVEGSKSASPGLERIEAMPTFGYTGDHCLNPECSGPWLYSTSAGAKAHFFALGTGKYGRNVVSPCLATFTTCLRFRCRHLAGVAFVPTSDGGEDIILDTEYLVYEDGRIVLRISECKLVKIDVPHFLHTAVTVKLGSREATSELFNAGFGGRARDLLQATTSTVYSKRTRNAARRLAKSSGGTTSRRSGAGRRCPAVAQLTAGDVDRIQILYSAVLRQGRGRTRAPMASPNGVR